jgi:hypothetical protein
VGEHCTFHLVGKLLNYANHPPAQLKNTLLISCTNNVLYEFEPTVVNQLSDAGVFQTSGLGHHYLAANSPYRAAGTPIINAALLTELKQTTTWPPLLKSGTLAQNTIWGPAVTRNTTTTTPPAPDIGYAYAVMDYLAQDLLVEGAIGSPATLLVTNGAIVGVDPVVSLYGIRFGAYSDLISVGGPDKLNCFVPLQIIQENGSTPVNPQSPFTMLRGAGLGNYPNALLRFTDLSMPAGMHFHMSWWSGGFVKLAFQDSQIRGSWMYLGSDIPNHSVTITNTLLERVSFFYHPYAAGSLHARNNLFKGGKFTFNLKSAVEGQPEGAGVGWPSHSKGSAVV